MKQSTWHEFTAAESTNLDSLHQALHDILLEKPMTWEDQRREAYEYEENAQYDYIQELKREHHDPYAMMPDDYEGDAVYDSVTDTWTPTGDQS